MNTKYLKKLRKEAHKTYGIKGCLELSDGTCVYVIGLREFSNKEDVGSYDIEDAKFKLQKMRDKYCISRVAELRNKYNRENKYRRL